MWADIKDKIVHNISRKDPNKKLARGKWVPIIEVGKDYDPDIYSLIGPSAEVKEDSVVYTYTKVARSLEEAIHSKRSTILGILSVRFQERTKIISSGYTDEEISTWAQQRAEAEAFGLSPEADTPMLDSMVAVRTITKEELVSRIKQNASNWSSALGSMLGRKQAIEDMAYAVDVTLEELVRIYNEELDTGW